MPKLLRNFRWFWPFTFIFQIANVRTASGKQAGEERVEPRFFLWYWYTSTATATKTTFTTTKTFTLTVCTPTTGFSYAGKLYTEIVKIYTIIVHYTTYQIFFCSMWLIMGHYITTMEENKWSNFGPLKKYYILSLKLDCFELSQ